MAKFISKMMLGSALVMASTFVITISTSAVAQSYSTGYPGDNTYQPYGGSSYDTNRSYEAINPSGTSSIDQPLNNSPQWHNNYGARRETLMEEVSRENQEFYEEKRKEDYNRSLDDLSRQQMMRHHEELTQQQEERRRKMQYDWLPAPVTEGSAWKLPEITQDQKPVDNSRSRSSKLHNRNPAGDQFPSLGD